MAMQTGLENKPWYFGAGIGVFLVILIVGAVQFFPVKKIDQQIASNESQLDELQKKIEAGRAAEKSLPQFREEVARLELELTKLRRILPSSRNTDEIIKKIKSLVDQGDFVLLKLDFPALQHTKDSGVYSVWNIQVSVLGQYHDLAILFNRLSNFSRIMNVEQVTITALAQQTNHTIQANFVAKTFVYVEPDDTKAANGKKTAENRRPRDKEAA